MKSSALILAAILMPLSNFWAQNTGSIMGIVLDEKTREPLLGVTVVEKQSKMGASTDEAGKFRLSGLPEGSFQLAFSYLGFEEKTLKNITLKKGERLDLGNIFMAEGGISLKEITVTPGSYSIMGGAEEVSRLTLSAQDLKNMSFAEDITRAVARLPGISSSDYSSKFAIRGGEADEVLISLDGMELYEPFHQRDYSGGLFCIVDIEAVQGVELLTGGFSAETGNRLSGAFNMRTKSVADNERHASVGLSTMNARVYADGKFAKNKGTYLFTARRGMLGETLKLVGNQEFFPHFYDGMGKVEYRIAPKHSLAFQALLSGDRTFINNSPDGDEFDQFDTKYDNSYAWLTLKSFYRDNLFSRTILYGGNINQSRTGGFDKYDNSDKGSLRVDDRRDYTLFGLKQDWNWEATPRFFLRAGWEAKQIKADYHHVQVIHELRVDSNEVIFNFDRDLDIRLKPSGQQVGVYVSGKYKLLDRLVAETGVRYDHTTYTGDKNFSPRASLAWLFSKKTILRAGWGHYYQSQFINNLDVNNGYQDFNPAELAKHYVLSLEHGFKNGISLRMEAYYKDLSNISPLWQNLRDHLENFPEARNDNARVVFNGITSKGIEFFLKHDTGGKISWWFSYALAEAADDIAQIDFNGLLIKRYGKVPRLNDQRHTIYADLNYRPSEKWHFNFSWHFYQGWPRTDYTYKYQILPTTGERHFYQVHSEFNGVTYPAYHRLDVRANRHFQLKKSRISAFVHVINAYNRQNLKKFDLDTRNDNEEDSVDANGNYVPFEDHKYWLGLTPVLGMAWEF